MINDSVLDVEVRGIRIRFATFNPRLQVWAERFEEIEPELLDLYDSLDAGSVVYDAGASIGNFALYAAIRARASVVAFEPEAQNFGTLELNHFLNRDRLAHPLVSLNVALSDERGIGSIYTRQYGAGEHVKILDSSTTRDTHETFEAGHQQSVIKLTLDELIVDFGLTPPNVLKIDVDGSELPLLKGATEALNSTSLHTVFIELNESERSGAEEILTRHGFRLKSGYPVVRLRGGFYEGLFNYIYER